MANSKVKRPLPSGKQHSDVRNSSKRPLSTVGHFEVLESRQLLSVFQPVDVRFQWGSGRTQTQVDFDGAGNCEGVTGPQAAAHDDCLLSGGSNPNRIVIGFSGPINKRTFNAAVDVSITGDVGSFGILRTAVKRNNLTLFTSGSLPTEPGSDLTLSLNGISGKRPTAVAMDPWSITLHLTEGTNPDPDPDPCTVDCVPDVTPPRVLSAIPNLSASPQRIDVSFSEDLQPGTVNTSSVRLVGRGPDLQWNTFDDRQISGSVHYNASADVAQFVVNGTLPADMYQIRVGGSGAIRDLSNNLFDQSAGGSNQDDFVSTFEVTGSGPNPGPGPNPDTTPPTVVSVVPSNQALLGQSPPEIAVTFPCSLKT